MKTRQKETGISWIGCIPAQWELCKLGTSFYMKGRIGWQGLNSDDFIDEGPYLVTGTDFRSGSVDWGLCYHISESRYAEDSSIHVRNDDILFTKDGTVGKVAYVSDAPDKVSLNSHLLLIRPTADNISNRYLYWVLQSDVFSQFKEHVQHGTVMDSVSQSNMERFITMLPPHNEQQLIADALDTIIGTIDSAIGVISKQLETLDNYRKSLIQETVTRGLDPDVEMKPSGIDWIGDIPQSWSVRKTKHLASISSGSTPDRNDPEYWDGNIPWLKTGELQNDVIFGAEECVTRKSLRDCSLRIYDVDTVLVAMYGQGKTRGMTGLLGIPSTVNQACAALVVNSSLVTPRYLWFAFQAAYDAIREEAQGSGQPNLSADIIARFHIPLPPLREQAKITAYLSDKLPTIDRLIAGKRKQLEILRAQRQSIIYEYVTGKRRVEGAGS